jgi:hypothetical protein
MFDHTDRVTDIIVATAVATQVLNSVGVVGPVSIADVTLLIALLTVATYQLLSGDSFVAAAARPVGLIMTALILWFAVAGPMWRVTEYLGFAAMLGLILGYVRSTQHARVVLWGMVGGALLAAVPTIYGGLVDPSIGGKIARQRLPVIERTIGLPFKSFAGFATVLLAPLPFAMIEYRRQPRRWLLAAIIVVLFAAVAIIQSRSTWLATAAMLTALIFGLSGKRIHGIAWRNAGASVLILVTTSIGMLISGYALFVLRPDTVLVRLAQYERAIDIIATYPLTGVHPPIVVFVPIAKSIPHNEFLLVGAATGLPGIVLFTLLLTVAVWGLTNGWRSSMTAPLALAIGAGLTANVVNISFAPALTRSVFALLGLASVLIAHDGHGIKRSPGICSGVENSTVSRVIQWAANESLVVTVLTYDATVHSRTLRTVWHNSALQKILVRVYRSAEGSSVVQIIRPKLEHKTE